MIKHVMDGLEQKVGFKYYIFLVFHRIIPWGLQLISSKLATKVVLTFMSDFKSERIENRLRNGERLMHLLCLLPRT